MDELNKIYETLLSQLDEFKINHDKFITKGNKSAAAKSRRDISEIKKLCGAYRKLSVETVKNLKK